MTCDQYKTDLALCASGGLDQPRAMQVREHVRTCPNCAARLAEYEAVCAAQSGAMEELNELPLPTRQPSARPYSRPSMPPPVWRWLLPAAGMGAVAAVLLLLNLPTPPRSAPPPEVAALPQPAPPQVGAAIATLAGYRHALVREGAASLDSVLERDADVLLKPTTVKGLQSLYAWDEL